MIWSWKHLGCDAAHLRTHRCPHAPRLEQAGSWLAPAWAQCGCWHWRGAEVLKSGPAVYLIFCSSEPWSSVAAFPAARLVISFSGLALQHSPVGWSAVYVSVQPSAFPLHLTQFVYEWPTWACDASGATSSCSVVRGFMMEHDARVYWKQRLLFFPPALLGKYLWFSPFLHTSYSSGYSRSTASGTISGLWK